MIGGTTYEEARTVTLFNQDPVAASNGGIVNPAGIRILLGGTCVHNSSSCVLFHHRLPFSILIAMVDISR